MSTLRQIEANRSNAQKSTGPTSVTGKAVSSMNSLKTGIHAKSLVLPSEELADLEQLIEEYYRSYRPASPDVRLFVDELIHCEWTLRRLRAAETQMWQHQNHDPFRDPQMYPLGRSATSYSATFSKLQYRVDATRRAYHRALQALKQLEAPPAPTPAPAPVVEPAPSALATPSLSPSPQTPSPQIGFVLAPPLPDPPLSVPAPNPAPHRPVDVRTGHLPPPPCRT